MYKVKNIECGKDISCINVCLKIQLYVEWLTFKYIYLILILKTFNSFCYFEDETNKNQISHGILKSCSFKPQISFQTLNCYYLQNSVYTQSENMLLIICYERD